MKAVRCGDRHVQVVDIPAPTGDGVLVNVRAAGICSSDLHIVSRGYPIAATLGHEVAGTLRDGRAVAIEPLSPCGHCDLCVQGDYFACRRGPGMVHGIGLDGGMAEQMLVPARCIVPLPANVRAEDACLIEPLAVAAHGVDLAPLTAASRVAVIGAGALGLAAVAILTERLRHVAVAARHAAQQDVAQRLGAALDPAGEYEVVFDCAGTSASLAQAARLCRPCGTIVLLATYWDGVELPANEVCMKSLRICASYLYGRRDGEREVEQVARLLARRPELPSLFITHRLPLSAAGEAFSLAADRGAGAIKVVLEP